MGLLTRAHCGSTTTLSTACGRMSARIRRHFALKGCSIAGGQPWHVVQSRGTQSIDKLLLRPHGVDNTARMDLRVLTN